MQRNNFLIDDHGAVGDATTLNTHAIQRAIDACYTAGGGRVIVGSGTYVSGSITLYSNIELHLLPGARIVGSTNIDDYQTFEAPGFRSERAPERSSQALIRVVDAESVAITGRGIIDGSGAAFYDTTTHAWGHFYAKPPTPRPRLLMALRCRDLHLEGVQFNESPCWTIWLIACERVTIRNIQIRADQAMINNDGIDLDGCRDVVISDSLFKTGDDCIAIRNMLALRESENVCENITINNCLLDSWCQGVRISCPGDGPIRNLRFNALQITSRANGIIMEHPVRYLAADGSATADVSDVWFSNINVRCGRVPFMLSIDEAIAIKRLADIHLSNFDCRSGQPLTLAGSPGSPLDGVHLDNVRVESTAESALVMRHCRNVTCNRLTLSSGVAGAGEGV